MKVKKRFEILSCNSIVKIEKQVEEFLNDDWNLHGNLIIEFGELANQYYQPLIKTEKEGCFCDLDYKHDEGQLCVIDNPEYNEKDCYYLEAGKTKENCGFYKTIESGENNVNKTN